MHTITLKTALTAALVIMLAGCATAAKDIQATYVSPLTYSDYDCKQLAAEALRINRRVTEITGHIDKRAKGDQVQTAVGLVLFWPALFFLGDNEEQNAELSRLKGEYEAVEKATIEKKCETQPAPDQELAKTESDDKSAAGEGEADVNGDKYDQLEKLGKLRDDNVISEEEFQAEKEKILAQ